MVNLVRYYGYPKTTNRGGGGAKARKNEIREEDCAKKIVGVEDNARKNRAGENEVGTKIAFDPDVHSIKTQNRYKEKNCYRKREKQKKETRKKVEKEVNYLNNYNDLLLENLSKEYYTTKSPHLIISRKWFFRIRDHTIMLRKGREFTDGNNRLVYYEIDEIGSKVKYAKKGKEYILNPSMTSRNMIYILVRLADLDDIEKTQYHAQFGNMIQKLDLKSDKDRCYVMLSIIQVDKDLHKAEPFIFDEDVSLLKRFYINQIAVKKGNYHFDTTGTIYGLGYGPKSNRNEFGHSVCKYANSKFSNIIISY